MKRTTMLLVLVVSILLLSLVGWRMAAPIAAQSGEPSAEAKPAGYALPWWRVASGGATLLHGKSYGLSGTIGQPDAGTLQGGRYRLGGGFWGGGAAPVAQSEIYLPLVLKTGL